MIAITDEELPPTSRDGEASDPDTEQKDTHQTERRKARAVTPSRRPSRPWEREQGPPKVLPNRRDT